MRNGVESKCMAGAIVRTRHHNPGLSGWFKEVDMRHKHYFEGKRGCEHESNAENKKYKYWEKTKRFAEMVSAVVAMQLSSILTR